MLSAPRLPLICSYLHDANPHSMERLGTKRDAEARKSGGRLTTPSFKRWLDDAIVLIRRNTLWGQRRLYDPR